MRVSGQTQSLVLEEQLPNGDAKYQRNAPGCPDEDQVAHACRFTVKERQREREHEQRANNSVLNGETGRVCAYFGTPSPAHNGEANGDENIRCPTQEAVHEFTH